MKLSIKSMIIALVFFTAWLGSCRAIVTACESPPDAISKRVDCETLKRAEFLERHFHEASLITGIPEEILLGLAAVESGMRVSAYSGRGDYGLMQVRCSAWKAHFKNDSDVSFKKCSDLYDSRTNVIVGAKILKIEYERSVGEDIDLRALTAYKAGISWEKRKIKPQKRYHDLVVATGEWLYEQLHGETCERENASNQTRA